MEDIDMLKRQRKIIRAAVTRIFNYCAKENATLEQVSTRADRAEHLLKEYENIQAKIDESVDEENLHVEEQYRTEIEDKYFSIKAKFNVLRSNTTSIQQQQQPAAADSSEITTAIQALIQHQGSMSLLMERFANNVQTENTSTPVENTTRVVSELRLPRVNLPEFDGNVLEWIRFKELFEAFVHNRTNLSNIEKLEYLNTKLKGDALSIIKHLKPTANSYEVAWALLNRKYNNNDRIKTAYMDLLFERPAIKSACLSEIKEFYNKLNEGFNALKEIDSTVDQWSVALLFNVEKKLDFNTATLWFREKQMGETSTFTQFLEFLERRVFELENMQSKEQNRTNQKDSNKRPQMRTYAASKPVCPICSSDHPAYYCQKFLKMSIDQRRGIVKSLNLCFNCLRNNHQANACKSSACKKCDKKHNSLLHMPASTRISQQAATSSHQENSAQTNNTIEVNNEENYVSTNTSQQDQQMHVILPTAIITISCNNNQKYKCRALLDSGSQGTLIAESCVQRLGLKRRYDKTIIFGLGDNQGNHSRGKVALKISGQQQSASIEIEALCLASLTKTLPSINIENTKLHYFRNLKLADPRFHETTDIDIILGADVYMQCCLSETIVHPSGSPAALNTIFGWVIMGKINSEGNKQLYSNHISIDTDQCLQRFWEIEEIPQQKQEYTPEEVAAETYYRKTTKRLENGRYEVRLPLKGEIPSIGESKLIATKRLHAMEKRFRHDEQIGNEYKAFLKEYIELGHMEEVDDANPQQKCFLPHHAVVKASSTTTKIRVVFDASSKSSNGLSLNDNLLVGPKTQRDLFDILISFRMHEIAYVGDVEKMYRQVLVQNDDRMLQCIVWRENESDNIKEYTLNTVTYGTASASYLATRTLNQVAVDNTTNISANTFNAIKDHFYVDDFIHSSENVQQAIELKDELCKTLSQSGFHLRKWSSNSEELLNTIPHHDRAIAHDTEIQNTSSVTTLGLVWNTTKDSFKYTAVPYNLQQHITKRTVLSNIAKLYDPMGWISPTVIQMKIFMQKIWLKGLNWDEPLTPDLLLEWNKILKNIEAIPEIKINRWLQYDHTYTLELHGFSDASELAYAAAVYAKVYSTNQKPFINLIAAKTRVAPVKQVSLPRLELCGAHLLVKLMSKIRSSIGANNIIMHGWTDSTIVLAWLSDHPRRWKTFVANRTAEIINIMPAQQWHHIKSQSNPADLATRGITTKELIENQLWWHGPYELHQQIENTNTVKNQFHCNMEERHKILTNTIAIQECNYIERYSSFSCLMRITALILRFVYNCKNKQQKHTGFITTEELFTAHNTIIKISQMASYSAEIKMLSSNKNLSAKNPLSSFSPFIDKTGILRVGGRLSKAAISYNQKHPILISKHQHIAKIIVQHFHLLHCHAGNRLLHYIIQLTYCIPSVSSIIRSTIYKCSVCMRQRATTYQQKMGDLPECRVTPAPVFSRVGVDFAGPYQVRAWKGRGSKTYKSWIAIFVCLVTKAIHIELVSELSTDAFVSSLRRFIARRGKPIHIYTDNGTNFVGADHQLRNLYDFLQTNTNQSCIQNYLANQQIKWHFIPPSGPNFGGLWEAGVKAIKYHLKRVLKEAHPTFEEMCTTLCQIEACLNSRPLCLKFKGDIDPLTPAHFLILRPMNSLPDEDTHDVQENRLSRWQYIQRLVYEFWKKWSIEYLNQLQQRSKWKQSQQNVAINDVVIIKDENTAPSQWVMGKITEVHPGTDGLIRVVTLKTKNGHIKRPINKLCPLFQ